MFGMIQFRKKTYIPLAIPGGGGGGGLLSLWSNPLAFYQPFLTEEVSFRLSSIDKWYLFHIPSLGLCITFNSVL